MAAKYVVPSLAFACAALACGGGLDDLVETLRAPRPCHTEAECRALQERANAYLSDCQASEGADCSFELSVAQRARAVAIAYQRAAYRPSVMAAPQTPAAFYCVAGAIDECFATMESCQSSSQEWNRMNYGAGQPQAACKPASVAYCSFKSLMYGEPKKYSCWASMAACRDESSCRSYTSPPVATGTTYEQGQDPNDCESYRQLGLLSVPQFPADPSSWTDEDVQRARRVCAEYDSVESLLWAGVHFLPSSVEDHPKQSCVMPYLSQGRSACETVLPVATRAQQRLDAEREQREAQAARQRADYERWLNTPEGRRATCLSNCSSDERQCEWKCSNDATCDAICQSTQQTCISNCRSP